MSKQKLTKWNISRGKMAADLESIVMRARLDYRNAGVPAFSEESHIIHQKLEYAFDIIAEQSKTMAEQQMQINELRSMLMKTMRQGSLEEQEETIEVTMTVTTRKKWTPETIERAFDHYRRDNAYFGLITPSIVRDNWSTVFVQCSKLTGMTLGQFLDRYNSSRSSL